MPVKQTHIMCDKTPLILLQRNHPTSELPHNEVHPRDENPSNARVLQSSENGTTMDLSILGNKKDRY